MKFNEKLIELRRKEGLSQEELGYKLNVTRQTVSKWELGQTTPEMDKLIEISKIFNISVDDLINESEEPINSNPVIEDQTLKKDNSREMSIKIILVVVLVVILILIVTKASTIISNKWNVEKEKNEINQVKQNERVDKIYDTIFDTFDNINHGFDNKSQEIEEIEIKANVFNAFIEMYSGTTKGAHVTSLLDNIITSNKKEDRKITVIYQESETQDETEIKNIKQNFETFNDYEVTFEYDAEGFIYKAIIENL